MFDKSVLHMDMDTFFVSVERKMNSALNGKPIIIGGTSNRGVVSSCSYEARKFGVRSGMAMKMARQLCPDAIYLRGDMDAYSKESKLVTEIISEKAPVFSKNSIDEFDLDLTGMDKYFGVAKWAKELRQHIIRETGLPISAGLSANRFVSKMATNEAKPCGEKQIYLGTEKAFLSPLHVSRMHGVGEVTARKLIFMGVRHIGVLGDMPRKILVREFGKNGHSLWEHANGIDRSEVVPYREEKSVSTESTFQTDTIDVRYLKTRINDMCSQLAFTLRSSGKLTSCVAVKIRYTDFKTYTHQRTIPYTANDRELLRHVNELFDHLYNRRVLVRLVGVRFSGLVRGNYQISLLDDTVRDIDLLQTLDKVRNRFGKDAVKWAAAWGK
ncbi:MAG: DNA polymerase IV [Saprospiraceae bacterium]|jgi:DNA polymerase-4